MEEEECKQNKVVSLGVFEGSLLHAFKLRADTLARDV